MTNHRHRHKYTFGSFIHDSSPASKEIGHIFEKSVTAVDHRGPAGVKQFRNVFKAFIDINSFNNCWGYSSFMIISKK
jgi:hypothetical protein